MSQTILESSHVHEATSQRIVVGPYLGEGISSAGLRCRFQQTGHIVPAYRDEEDGRIKCLIEVRFDAYTLTYPLAICST